MKVSAFFNRLHIKVMLLLLAVSVVPLSIVSAFSLRTAGQLVADMVTRQLENVADDKVTLLQKWISERKADLQVIAGSSVLRSLDPSQMGHYLQLVGINYQVYEGFVVATAEGVPVFDSSGKQQDCAREEWFRQAAAGKLYLSPISLESEGKESVFRISAPITGEAGEVKGVVCATVGTGAILSEVFRVSLGKTGELYIVDKEGTFLAHKEPRRILRESIAQSGSFRNIFAPERSSKAYTDYRGVKVLGTSRRVPDSDWYLVVEQDEEEAYEGVATLKRYAYILIAFSICGAVILTWLLTFYVVAPIRKLSKVADALAKGKFDSAPVRTRRTDEIGTLYSAFGNMASQLRARQNSLEQKVASTEAELKESDTRLKQTEEAAARSERFAALGRLASGVTHEIRTPLTSLKLFLQSVRGEIEISPEYKEDFQLAMDQIKRIEATINRFLDFAKPQEPIFSSIDVAQLIDESLLIVRPRASQQEVTVEREIDNNLPRIRGDRKQLQDVLLNLVVNAFDAMPNRSRLTIRASAVRAELNGKMKQCVRLAVSDTGRGIEEENIERIFDPFFTTKASGTGLGLPIVRTTVQKHGGEVKVESTPGKGTTLSVFLPAIVE
jgi:signal transduction histidine kinase